MTPAQIAHGVLVDSLLTRAGFVGVTALAVMVWLRFRTGRAYRDRVWAALGTTAVVFFGLSAGAFSFAWPWPGAILDLALAFVELMLGVFVGWLVFADESREGGVPTKGEAD